MEKTKFNFDIRVRSSAHAIYDVLFKYGPRILKTEESKKINKVIAEVYLNVYLNDIEEFISQIDKLNLYAAIEKRNLLDNIKFFEDNTGDSPLKTLNNSVLDVLHGSRLDKDSIEFVISRMKERKSTIKMKSKTFVSMEDGVKERYVKESVGQKLSEIETDKRKMVMWVNEVIEKGIDEVMKDKSWGDHMLGRDGFFKGKRSVRLSGAGRVVYTLTQEVRDDVLINKVNIVRITSSHDYKE